VTLTSDRARRSSYRLTPTSRPLMSFKERKNLLVECVRLLPLNRVACIGHDYPFIIFQVSCPDAHQGRRRKQISICGNDKSRRGDGRDFGEGVWSAGGLIRRSRLARMLINLGPVLGALRVGASIGWSNLPVDSRQFSDVGNFDTCDNVGDLLICYTRAAIRPMRSRRPRWRRYQSSTGICR
jgi:hypothetical protein